MSQTTVAQRHVRRPPSPGQPVTVVFGRPRFSPGQPWEHITANWSEQLKPLASRIVIEHTRHNELGSRLLDNRSPVHVVVPLTSPVTGHEVLGLADSVVIAASYGPGQPPVIDQAALHAMRPGSLLINIARSGLLDDRAAVAALFPCRR